MESICCLNCGYMSNPRRGKVWCTEVQLLRPYEHKCIFYKNYFEVLLELRNNRPDIIVDVSEPT